MSSVGRFSGKHGLVTGGTSGIGAGIAAAFLREGATVTVTGLTEAEVGAVPPIAGLSAVALDVSNEAAIRELVGGMPRLDFLVNAAGMLLRQGREFDPVSFAKVVDVNLTGMMRVCVACRELLARNGGAIVNIASMLSYFGGGHAPAYSASKGGVVQLTKSLAIAWAADNIRVNAVAPGWIATALTKPLREDPVRSQAILDRTPMKRWGTPDDVAGPALFLCSPEAAFVTGACLTADGGYSVM
ncbi:SDR family NAD(P)-dependent oxidoreductase [Zavarzinella formosa]|uniref:SDR family NAD(P)-dependent oxidoreductase n=1 Tax=Zavarzinella formosa TaxID=360055 RepID=UPI0002DF6817|nr:SDR family oxidoreductase [Zavarzinella formosa]